MKNKTKKFSIEKKLFIVNESYLTSVKQVCAEYKVNPSLVYKWRKEQDALMQDLRVKINMDIDSSHDLLGYEMRGFENYNAQQIKKLPIKPVKNDERIEIVPALSDEEIDTLKETNQLVQNLWNLPNRIKAIITFFIIFLLMIFIIMLCDIN